MRSVRTYRPPFFRAETLEKRTLFSLSGSFFAGESPPLSSAIGKLVTGDFNSDGNVDLISGSSLLDGDGTGGFRSARTISTPAMATADFNHDGNLDLLTSGTTIDVLPGNGDGTFGNPINVVPPYTSGSVPVAVDLNRDGQLDVVAVSRSSSTSIQIALGNADGTFSTGATYANLEGTYTEAASTADFNSDGNADVAYPRFGGIQLMLGTGSGTLAIGPLIPASSITTLVVGDVDENHTADLLYRSSSGITLALGNGDATFTLSTLAAGATADTSLAVDVNGDVHLDLVYANASGVTVLPGDGHGAFASAIHVHIMAARYLAVGRFDQDSSIDLAYAQSGANTVATALGVGNGTFICNTPSATNTLPYVVASLKSADFNNDGNLDVVASGYDGIPQEAARILFGDGHGHFPTSLQILPGAYALTCVAGDFNQDGNADLATDANNVLSIYYGHGDGTFATAITVAPMTRAPNSISVADLNNDGRTDFAYARSSTQQGFGVALRNADGSFTVISPSGSSLPLAVSGVGDFNRDGKMDIAGGYAEVQFGKGARIYLGNGNGTFTAGATLVSGMLTTLVAVSDFDLDGIADLAVVSIYGSAVRVLKGAGDGTFTVSAALTCTTASPILKADNSLRVADIDNDGYPDLIAGSLQAVSIFLNTGSMTFSTSAIGVGDFASATAGDFDNDGQIDLVAGSDAAKTIYFLKNRGVDPSIAPSFLSGAQFVDRNTVTLTFDRPLSPGSVEPADVRIENLSTGTIAAPTLLSLSADGRTVLAQLPATLADGNYRFRIFAGSITSSADTPNSSDASLSGPSIFILAGDANHDRVVNFDDLLILAQNYGLSGKTFSQGNLNYSPDGKVDFDDLLILAQHYNTSLLAVPVVTAKRKTRSATPLSV